jgi:glycosyltransferase involved in cell wall biosynthesis
MYRFTVVIPIFNKADVLDRAVKSVLAQTFKDYEIILVDDGSLDETETVCKKYINHNNVTYIHQVNQGTSVARNQGIMNSNAELITFLDPDDEWYANHLEVLNSIYEDCGRIESLYSTAYRIQLFDGSVVDVKEKTYNTLFADEKERMWKLFANPFIIGNDFRYPYIHTNSIMVPKSVFDVCGYFTVGCKRSQDTDMWYRIGLQYPFILINEVTTLYHREDSTETKKQKMNYQWPFLNTADSFILHNPANPLTLGVINFIDNMRVSMARHLILEGRKIDAQRMLDKVYSKTGCGRRFFITRLLLYVNSSLIAKVYYMRNRAYFGK